MQSKESGQPSAPLARLGLADNSWREGFARFYQSQGLIAGSQRSSNECGPAAATMLAVYWLARGSRPPSDGLFITMKAALRPVLEQVPAPPRTGWSWLDQRLMGWRQRAGATASWGLARVLRQYFAANQMNLAVEWRSHCTVEDLRCELSAGRPCAALLIWPKEKGSGGHWVVVVGGGPENGLLYLLDPDPAVEASVGAERVRQVDSAWFERYWGMSNWWSRLLGLRNVLVTVRPE